MLRNFNNNQTRLVTGYIECSPFAAPVYKLFKISLTNRSKCRNVYECDELIKWMAMVGGVAYGLSHYLWKVQPHL